MKPLLFHAFSTFAVGGAQTRVVSLANALSGKYRHAILAMDGNHAAASGLNSHVEFSIENIPVVKTAGVSLANLRHMREILHRLRPDLLCTYNWGAIEWSLADRFPAICPQIHIEDGFGPDETPDRQHWRRTAMRRLFLSRCTRVVVPSQMLRDVALRKWRLPANRVLYLPNGIDCNRFAREPDEGLLASLGIVQGDTVVGTVAALRAEKNLDRLLHLFGALPKDASTKLVIVGGGPQREALAQTAKRLGISERVVMTGAMAAPERILGRFDIFALSSDTEQMPNSILEAMAAGLAIISTDVGDVKKMVAAENAGFVIARTDMAALENGLLALAGDRALRAQIGRANRNKVRADYDLPLMVERYDVLFCDAMRVP